MSSSSSVNAKSAGQAGQPTVATGGAIRVNVDTIGQQTLRGIGAALGGYAVAYLSQVGTGTPTVHQQQFDAAGARSGAEAVVQLDAAQTATAAATLADGGIAVASAQTTSPADQPWVTRTAIVVRRYGPTGIQLGAAREVAVIEQSRVGATSMRYVAEPSVLRFEAGGFVVGWSLITEDASGKSPQFWTQRFDTAGQPLGVAAQAGSGDLNTSYQLTATPAGGTILTTSSRVMGRTFLHYQGLDGAVAPVLPAGAVGVAQDSLLLPLYGGGSLLLSPVQNVGSTQFYAASGQPQGSAGSLPSMPRAATALPDGGYVLFFAAATAGQLQAQRFDSGGRAVGSAQTLTTADGTPQGAVLADGSLGLAWTSTASGDADVYTQRLRP